MNVPIGTPGESQDSLYLPTDVSPEEVFQAIGRLRKEARDEIDRLIGFLDATDDYVSRELEDSVDDNPQSDEGEAEPSLGWTEQEARWGRHAWSADIDAEHDNCDSEPVLAAPENHPTLPYTATGYFGDRVSYGPAGRYRDPTGSQEAWSEGNSDDREGDEHDGREPDVDDEDGADKEPSFGWSDEEAARGRYPSLMGAVHEGDL